MKNIVIKETTKEDLLAIQELWSKGDVMKFVGFPEGLQQTIEQMHAWYEWISKSRPTTNHYSIFENDVYCGESFFQIDKTRKSAALDIKLFSFARGKGIAKKALSYAIDEAFKNDADRVWVDPNIDNRPAITLYEKLGFKRKEMPAYLIDDDITSIYMEIERQEWTSV